MNEVSFKVGLKQDWENLRDAGLLNDATLYFCTDSCEIFKGEILFATSKIENLSQEDEYLEFYGGSALDIPEGAN